MSAAKGRGMNLLGYDFYAGIAASRTVWHLNSKTDRARYRVDYIVSLHRVYCRELRSYGWRLIVGRLQLTATRRKGERP